MGADEHLDGQKLHYEERLSKLRGQNQQIINETVQLRAKFRKSLQLLQVYQQKLAQGAAPQPGADAAKRLQMIDAAQGVEPGRPAVSPHAATPVNPLVVSGARARSDALATTEPGRARGDALSSDADAVPFRTPPRDEPLAPALVSLDAKALQRLAFEAKRELDARTAAYQAAVSAGPPSEGGARWERARDAPSAAFDGAALGALAANLAQLGVQSASTPVQLAPAKPDGPRHAREDDRSAGEVMRTPPGRSDRRAAPGGDEPELAKPAAAAAAGGDELDALLEVPAFSLRTTTLALSPAQVPAVCLSPLPRALAASPSPRAAQTQPPPSAERARTNVAPARSSPPVRIPSVLSSAAPAATPRRVAAGRPAAPRRALAATEPRARREFAAAVAEPPPPPRAAEPLAPPPAHWQQSRAAVSPREPRTARAAQHAPASARAQPAARAQPSARQQPLAGFESASDDGSETDSLFDLIEALNGRGAEGSGADGGGAGGIEGEPLRSLCALIDDMEGGGRNGRRGGRDASERSRPRAVAFDEPRFSGRTRPLANDRHALPGSRPAPRANLASARDVASYTARVDSLLSLSRVSAGSEDDDGESFGSASPFAYTPRPWR